MIVVALILGYTTQWWMNAPVDLGSQPKFGLILSLIKSSHMYLGYLVLLAGFWECKLGMDVYAMNPAESIPDGWFWGPIGFWLSIFVLFELFKKRRVHRTLRRWLHQLNNDARERSDSADSDTSFEGESTSGEGLHKQTEQQLLLKGVDFQWSKFMKSMGETYVRLNLPQKNHLPP